MPSESKAQHNAMEAAANGESTLGIPKKVGAEFAKADEGKSFRKSKPKRSYSEVDSKARAEALRGPSTGAPGEKKVHGEDDSMGAY
jgi:hypothetical protein